MDLTPLEIKLHLSFLHHLSELITALSSLSNVIDGVSNSQILVKYNQLMNIMAGTEPTNSEFDNENNFDDLDKNANEKT